MNTSLMRRSTLARPSRPSCPGRARLQPVVAASSFLTAGASLAKACPYRTLGVGYDATEEEIRGERQSAELRAFLPASLTGKHLVVCACGGVQNACQALGPSTDSQLRVPAT